MKKFCLVLAMVLAMVACRAGKSIETINYDTPEKNLTLNQMRDAIAHGCIARQWHVTELDPNTIEASITVRGKHNVVVTIPFTPNHYEIKYKSSSNMEYKMKDGEPVIHPNYNKWVHNLDYSIQAEIGGVKYNKK